MLTAALLVLVFVPQSATPPAPGRLVDLGGHRLQVNCTGRGRPTVVVEVGLGDASTDWVLVQRQVAAHTRVCTYDRGGYAWSDPGPLPRTFDQLNLELHDVMARAGEHAPFVLVGHSFGGGVVRNYARIYPGEVAGLVLVDIVSEDQFIPMGPHAGRIRDDAKGRAVPPAREEMREDDRRPAPAASPEVQPIEPPYDRLPRREQQLHAWAATRPSMEEAENSQREWSAEYFARWAAEARDGSLGARPLVVLTRAKGGYRDSPEMKAADMERNRLESQRALARLSSAGTQQLVESGHNMHVEVPGTVAAAVIRVVDLVRAR
jgi:pimeloyl-ACP methyl ester carboxylesterase